MKPYGSMADLHFHNWSAFSSIDETGRNTRLSGLLSEFIRCCTEVKKAGGDTIYIAGDVFHVRGSIAPSVLNPVLDVFKAAIELGINIVVIPGNHDLEGKHSNRLGAAVTALENVGVTVVHKTGECDNVLLVPWCENVEDLWEELRSIEPGQRERLDALIHAPIDGVLPGLSGALDPKELEKLGYKRIFAGHYHNHVQFPGNKVFSIGALAHHSWSDVGTKAGFLIVYPDQVRWMKSHLPEFIDITGEVSAEELPLIVEGNFVRIKTEAATMAEVEGFRAELTGMGAKGVVIQNVKKSEVKREAGVVATVSAGASLEVSVAEFIKSKSLPNAEQIESECISILSEAGA